MKIMGPILLRELVSTLRRPRTFLTLLALNAAVGAAVIFAWRWAEAQPLTSGQVGDRMFQIVSLALVGLITLVAPALPAGAVTLERERGTLTLLRTTPISTQRLLVEKFLASVAFLLVLVLTTAPLMAMSLLLGGVGVLDVLGVILILLLFVAVCGAVGVTTSTAFLRTHSSLAVTYLILLPVGAALAWGLGAWGPQPLALGAVILGIPAIAAGLGGLGVAQRLIDQKDSEEVEPESMEDVSIHAGMLLDRRAFPDSFVWPPRRNEPIPDWANPVFEKDTRLEAPARSGRMISILIQGGLYLSIPVLLISGFVFIRGEGITWPSFLFLSIFIILIGPAFSSTAFSSERERKTLDLLLSTPLSPMRVVAGKVLASLRGSLGMAALLLMPILFFLCIVATTGESKLWPFLVCLPVYLGILVLTAVAITVGGIWISIQSRTSLRAMVVTYCLVGVLAVLPVVVFLLMVPFTGMDYEDFRWITTPSPIAAVLSASAMGGGEAALPLDPEGSIPIWALFLGFWGLLNPVLAFGAIFGYRRYSRRE